MKEQKLYAEVILPLPLKGTFSYKVPAPLISGTKNGSRVIVSFGKKKVLTGIVHSIHSKEPKFEAKAILDVLDNDPIVNELQIQYFEWIANYYMCSIGEVMNAALPAALKLASESYISLKEETTLEQERSLTNHEFNLLEFLKVNAEISIKDAGEVLGIKHPQKIIKSLSSKGYVDLFEKLSDKFIEKKIKKIRIADQIIGDDLEAIINELESKPKQQDVLLFYLKLVPVIESPETNQHGIEKQKLLKEPISKSSLNTLIKNNIMIEWDEVISRLPEIQANSESEIQLTDIQSTKVEEINHCFSEKDVTLLHGITGSGKTEIYIDLIKSQLASGNQVLYLLPEIALTTQIIKRLQRIFGNTFGIYHSKYSDNERVEIWNKVLHNEYDFVVGVRSSIYLPFTHLGLIIVDEEHEPSYKQYDPAPRYHARDASIYLAKMHQAKVLLGSATPSLESYKNAIDGKYGLVNLTKRHGASYTPQIHYANMVEARKRHQLKGNFSEQLFNEINTALEKKEQVIIFQNRRGYASHVHCENCGHIPKCPSCDVSLTYHQYNNKLICHYCGYNQSMYSDCVKCGSTDIKNVGYGTEELEEELKILFPSAIIQRMDLDTTRSKYSYQRIIESFEEGEIDILIGTQMVSKGLDFNKVNLVGVMDADRIIHFPDFRSHERAYQLITQVSGRSGRKSQEGKVIIQTRQPEQPLLQLIKEENYQHFFGNEISERELFRFPPITRLIKITFKHPIKEIALQGANFYMKEIQKNLGSQRVDGPIEPGISKLRNRYLFDGYVRLEKTDINLTSIKDYLWRVKQMMLKTDMLKSVGVVFDVDPI